MILFLFILGYGNYIIKPTTSYSTDSYDITGHYKVVVENPKILGQTFKLTKNGSTILTASRERNGFLFYWKVKDNFGNYVASIYSPSSDYRFTSNWSIKIRSKKPTTLKVNMKHWTGEFKIKGVGVIYRYGFGETHYVVKCKNYDEILILFTTIVDMEEN